MPESNETPSSQPRKETTPPDTLEEQLVSTLYLAGEAVVPDLNPEPAHHAVPADDRDAPLIEDFDWLNEIIALLRRAIDEDPKRAELLRLLPQGLGDGEVLRVPFGNLFPEQRKRGKELRTPDGKRVLTETQVEILSATAVGMTPKQIAEKRGCARANVTNILESIEGRLHTQSPQESVAVAMSMGYLPLDMMDYILAASRCAPRDYSILDTVISWMGSIQRTSNPIYWQELAAFGLLLMLTTGIAAGAEAYVVHQRPARGVLYRLECRADGIYQAHQVVEPGLLRRPCGLAIAPPAAQREGFTPGNVFVAHYRATAVGGNAQDIAEFTSEGKVETVRAFCGGRTIRTHLDWTHGLAFTPSGALLATSNLALLRFSKGGGSVQKLIDWCCADVCADRQGNIYLAHSSGRGGSIGVYTRHGKLLRKFAQQQPGTSFSGLRVTTDGGIVALCHSTSGARMQVYDAQGEHRHFWPVPNAVHGSFAFDEQNQLLYVPCIGEIAVYTPAGTLQQCIPLDEKFTPATVALDKNGTLWVCGSPAPEPQ